MTRTNLRDELKINVRLIPNFVQCFFNRIGTSAAKKYIFILWTKTSTTTSEYSAFSPAEIRVLCSCKILQYLLALWWLQPYNYHKRRLKQKHTYLSGFSTTSVTSYNNNLMITNSCDNVVLEPSNWQASTIPFDFLDFLKLHNMSKEWRPLTLRYVPRSNCHTSNAHRIAAHVICTQSSQNLDCLFLAHTLLSGLYSFLCQDWRRQLSISPALTACCSL